MGVCTSRVSPFDPVIHALTAFLGLESSGQSGRQHTLDANYFDRIDAMTYTLNHDDGQSTHDLGDADMFWSVYRVLPRHQLVSTLQTVA